MSNHLLFIGTQSNAGKTFIAGFVGKILKEIFNINTCPFKGQNMSNYAVVCEKNKEISIAQASQADLMGIEPVADMNPVLLKPLGEGRSQVVVRGIPTVITKPKSYYKDIDSLKVQVDEAFYNLKIKYDKIILEGAGSGFELNLKYKDLANQHMMEKNDVDSVLVANIENGGIFASILGSYQLMSDNEKSRFKGVIINNFRGDISLFKEGVKIIEEWGIPVLGVVPNIQYGIDSEDSLSEMKSYEQKNKDPLQVGVIKYPRASNINDVEPLVHSPDVQVSFITQNANLDVFDKVILPGSRAVMDDLKWLKSTGLADTLKSTTAKIYGICGGYQMLHTKLDDPLGSESRSAKPGTESGLGFIPAQVEFKDNKILKRQDYKLFENINAHGFEMHTGVSDKYPIFFDSECVKGSIVHGVFHNDEFRNWWITETSVKRSLNWSFKEWKRQKQDEVAEVLVDIIDWDRMLR